MSNPFDDLKKERDNAYRKQQEEEKERKAKRLRRLEELAPKYDTMVKEVLNQLKEARYTRIKYPGKTFVVAQLHDLPIWVIKDAPGNEMVGVELVLDSNDNPIYFLCQKDRGQNYSTSAHAGLSREELIRTLNILVA